VVDICGWIIELSFYCLIFFVTFSISLVEIAAGIMIGFWILKKILDRDLKSINIFPAKILGLYFLWMLLSCFNSAYFDESFRGIFKVLEASLLFLIPATEMNRPHVVKRSFYVIAGATVVTCLNGIYQYFSGIDLIRGRELISQDYLRRISSSFVHPNSFGIYLFIVAIILAAFLISRNMKFRNRVLVSIPFLLSLLCLFLTRSRGSWMSFSVAAVILAAMRSKIAVMIFLVVLVLGFMIMPSGTKDSIMDTTDLKSGTSWERVMLWKGTINMIKVHPVLGFGINTYSRNFPAYKPEEYAYYRYSHNCYLQMASEIGIPGAVLFLCFLAGVLFMSLKRILAMVEGQKKDMARGLLPRQIFPSLIPPQV